MIDRPTSCEYLVDRIGQRRERVERQDVVVRSFAIAPTVIAPAASGGFIVHFLPAGLADISNDQGAGSAPCRIVEAETPRISQAEGPDFRKDARTPGNPTTGHPTNGLVGGTV